MSGFMEGDATRSFDIQISFGMLEIGGGTFQRVEKGIFEKFFEEMVKIQNAEAVEMLLTKRMCQCHLHLYNVSRTEYASILSESHKKCKKKNI